MTLIEIRPYRDGWKVFEALGTRGRRCHFPVKIVLADYDPNHAAKAVIALYISQVFNHNSENCSATKTVIAV